METLVNNTTEQFVAKFNYAKIKADIKVMAEKQKYYRNQRKTVFLVGERTMSPTDATYEHARNSDELRIMYAAYGLMRGKSYSQTENNHAEENHPLYEHHYQYHIDKLMIKYAVENK